MLTWTYYAHPCAVESDNVLDGGVALGLVETVSARLVECAEVFCDEAGDVVLSSQGVILKDLVLSVASSSTDDTELGVETLGCEGVFTDVFPPDWDEC